MLVTVCDRVARQPRLTRFELYAIEPKVPTQASVPRGFALARPLVAVSVLALLIAIGMVPAKRTGPFRRLARQTGRNDLWRLDSAQARFRARSGRYGDLVELTARGFTLDTLNSGMTIVLAGVPAGATGYTATLTAATMNDTCAVVRGDAQRPPGMPPMAPAGVPVCWP